MLENAPRMATFGSSVAAIAGPVVLLALFAPMLLPGAPGELSARAALQEQALAESEPEILVIGNSLVGRGVDSKALAKHLGLDPSKVATATAPGSEPPTWLAVLRDRVYAHGHQPKVVVIYDYLSRMHVTSPTTDLSATSLNEQLADGELAPSVDTSSSPAMRRIQRRREAARSSVIDGVKHVIGQVVWADADGAATDAALARVFADDQVIRSERGVPGSAVDLSTPHARQASNAAEELDLERSLIPQIAALVAANGGKLVLANAGKPPSNTSTSGLSNAAQLRAIDYMNRAGIGWLDLRAVTSLDADFADPFHLSPSGKAKLTAALGTQLEAWDALNATQLPAATLPIPVLRSARTGEPRLPKLHALRVGKRACTAAGALPAVLSPLSPPRLKTSIPGVLPPFHIEITSDAPLSDDPACTGELDLYDHWIAFRPRTGAESAAGEGRARIVANDLDALLTGENAWVFPGTTLTFAIGDDAVNADSSLLLRTVRVSGGAGPVTVAVDDHPVALERYGQVEVAKARLLTGLPEHTVSVTSPADGPFVLVRQALVQTGTSQRPILGSPETAFDGGVRLIGTYFRAPRPKGSPVETHTAVAPALDVSPPRVSGPGNVLFTVAAPPQTGARFWGARISPLRVVMEPPSDTRIDFVTRAPATSGGRGSVVLLKPTVPANTSFDVVLDPALAADAGVWLLPGDSLSVRMNPKDVWIGADTFSLASAADGATDASLHLSVLADGEELLTRDVPMNTLAITKPLVIALPHRLSADTREVELKLSSPATAPWVQVATATLETRSPFVRLPPPPAAAPVAAVHLTRRALGTLSPLDWKRGKKACLFTTTSDELKPVSWANLKRFGAQAASPVTIAFEGTALPARGGPFFAQEGCEAGGLVAKDQLLAQARDANGLSVRLAPPLPLRRPEGDYYWLYPRGEVEVPLPEGTHALRVQATAVSPTARLSAQVEGGGRSPEVTSTAGALALVVPVANGARSVTLFSDGFSLVKKLEAVDATGTATSLIQPTSVTVP